jgi:prepilin-type N-terminal cleavage/methylation domain-containing protein
MHISPTSHAQIRSARAHGFTLVEVMISIAIALLLILGISQIFALAQRTTGTGTTVLTAVESNRGIQEVLLNDFRAIDNGVDSPGMVIASYPQAVFRTPIDQQQDRDGNPRTLNNPSANTGNIAPPEVPTTIDDRIHRTDVMGFFARGTFSRQTGNRKGAVCLTSPTTSGEAFIWIGHLALPDNNALKSWKYLTPATPGTGGYFGPGTRTAAINPNNFYASQWALGREVMLLDPTPNTAVDGYFFAAPTATSDPLSLWTSKSTDTSTVPLLSSRYDLVATSIAAYRNSIAVTNLTWWQGLSGILTGTPTAGSPPPTVTKQQRYEANPYIIKPGTVTDNTVVPRLSAALAQASPVFVRGCTQFIVEFAGDYLKQDPNTGLISGPGQDGQIDFAIDSNGARQIRWYGYPRTTSLNGALADVMPVSTAAGITPGTALPPTLTFERSQQPNGKTWVTNGSTTNGLPAIYAQPYVVAWGPDTDAASIPRPKMIRITLAVDDPNGHLSTEQVYEYVFALP